MSLVETRSRDKNILRYCHPKKCIPWCIDRAVNTPFYDVVFVFNPFAAGATVVLISASTWKGKTERFQSVDLVRK